MPGEDDPDVPEMTVGQLKTHVDARFEQVVDEVKRHTSTLFESLRDDIHKVADGVAALSTGFVESRSQNAADHARFDKSLDDHEARIARLESMKHRSRALTASKTPSRPGRR